MVCPQRKLSTCTGLSLIHELIKAVLKNTNSKNKSKEMKNDRY